MSSSIEMYEDLPSVQNAEFNGEVEIEKKYDGEIELEVDDWIPHIWLNNVPLDDIVEDFSQEYDISSIKAVYPADRYEVDEIDVKAENSEEIEDIGWFSGFGMELEGPIAYIEHPTEYTTGMAERGPSHQHAKHYLEGRVEADTSHTEESVERALSLVSDTLEAVEEREEERRRKIRRKWAEENDYHEKGRIKKWFMRKFKGPKDGNVYLNPTAVIYDLDKTGLTAEQLLEASDQTS